MLKGLTTGLRRTSLHEVGSRGTGSWADRDLRVRVKDVRSFCEFKTAG